MTLDPGLAIAAAGVLITAVQLWLGQRQQRLDATFRLIELMQEESSRNARFELAEILKSAGETDFGSLPPATRAKIASVGLLFGLAGFLARRRRIDVAAFLDAYGYSVVVNHQRLGPYARWRLGPRSTTRGSLWKDFDWLESRARHHIGVTGPVDST